MKLGGRHQASKGAREHKVSSGWFQPRVELGASVGIANSKARARKIAALFIISRVFSPKSWVVETDIMLIGVLKEGSVEENEGSSLLLW